MSFDIGDTSADRFSIDARSVKDRNSNEISKSNFPLPKAQDSTNVNLHDKSITPLNNNNGIVVGENGNTSYTIDDVTITEFLEVEGTVQFSQEPICNNPLLPENLKKIRVKYDGLCELICNQVLIDDLLGKGGKDDGNFFKSKINIDSLKKDAIAKSHILNVYSIFRRLIAFVFGIYPDNIFSKKDQWKLVNKNESNNRNEVNTEILFEGLGKIESGTTLKLEVFRKTPTSFFGHSLLIKKIDKDNFTFFDPNAGEFRGLFKGELAKKINEQLAQWKGTDIFISRGDAYLKKLSDKNIIDKTTNIMKEQFPPASGSQTANEYSR